MKSPRKPAKRRRLSLRLYIAGNAPNSVLAVANAKALCEAHFAGGYLLDVIDLLAEPARALTDGIIVTPTLVIVFPTPLRKIVGNLSEASQVLLALGRK